MLSELATPHIRCCLSAIPSDLMKFTVVDESLSSMNQQFCSRENQLLQLCNLYLSQETLMSELNNLSIYNSNMYALYVICYIVTLCNFYFHCTYDNIFI